MAPLIFISHASASRPLADAFRNLLVLGGLPAQQIFYTSGVDTTVPEWTEFNSALFTKVREATAFLSIIDSAYLQSGPCLMELGGATTLELPVFAVVVPGVSFEDVNRTLGTRQAWSLAPEKIGATLDRLQDFVQEKFNLTTSAATWSTAKTEVRRMLEDAASVAVIDASPEFEVRGASRTWSTFFDRLYEHASSSWSYSLNEDPRYWDGVVVGRRRLVSLVDGLDHLNISFTRAEDAVLPFVADRPPVVKPRQLHRSGEGDIHFAPAHHSLGAKFAFKILFRPSLSVGEVADVSFTIAFDRYKFACREDILMATQPLEGGSRDWDYNSRDVEFPTDELVLEAFIPMSLQASPIDVGVSRRGMPFESERAMLRRSGGFKVSREQRAGEEGWLVRVHRESPPLSTLYRIRWTPPHRSTES